MYPELLDLGFVKIHSYGVMVAVAFFAGILVSLYLARREKIRGEEILDAVLIVMLAAIIGARTFYVIEFHNQFETILDIFKIWEGGLVFYGGLLFALAALIIFSYRRKIPALKILDIAAPATALGYAFGRIGCFLNGCCYGIPSNVPWAVKFPHLLDPRHPTQIYASIAGLVIFVILLYLYRFKKFDGQIFCAGIVLYSIYRFYIEYVRVNNKYLFGLSESQLISIALIVFAAVFYAILYRREKQK